MSSEMILGIVLTIVLVLSSTAHLAVRHFSRVRLAERLERRNRLHLLDKLVACRGELLFSSSFLRISSILGMVLLIAHWFGARPAPEHEPITQYLAIFFSAMVVVMVVGVEVPNAWSRYAGDGFLTAALPAMLVLRYVLYPFTWLQHLIDDLVRRLAGVPKLDDQLVEADQIEKEILGVVSEGELAGAVREEDADMIESVMHFRETQVGEIMTPRTEIVALPASATLIEAKDIITRNGHSRIPVYDESLDDIQGVLYAKDLLTVDDTDPFDPRELMRKVPFIPETKRITDLLQEMREKKVHVAIVLDEYGGTAGLVTMEDIVEEIVGEIPDEYEPPEPEPMRRIDEHTLDIDARVHIDELNDELSVELPDDEDYDTVGGFLFSQMGKIPATGEEYRYQNLRFHVLDAEERKINRLRVSVLPQEDGARA